MMLSGPPPSFRPCVNCRTGDSASSADWRRNVGEPRETVDVDLTLLTGFGGEERFIRTLLQHFEARIENAADFALAQRVLLRALVPASA